MTSEKPTALPEQNPPKEGSSSLVTAAPPPAKLPENSAAAAAQRLSDAPVKPNRAIYYPAPQKREHPLGWRTKRYLKRKNLRLSNNRVAASERFNNRYSLLPLSISVFSILIVVLGSVATIAAFIKATDMRYGTEITTLQDILPKDNLKVYDTHGKMFYQALDQGTQTTDKLEEISPHMQHAQIAIEDQNFWEHPGFDITGIVRAAIDDLTQGHIVSGASTITQQLIKNAIVGDETTVIRKLQEIILAPEVTRHYTKEQILSMYLNTTYYGEQAYGVESGAYTYFGLTPKDGKPAAFQLNVAQAATLAGIPSSPSARDPMLHPEASKARTTEVLNQMFAQKYITEEEHAQALAEIQKPDFLKPGKALQNDNITLNLARYTKDELADLLHVKVSDLSRAGLSIKTTYDTTLQAQVTELSRKHIEANTASHHMSNAATVVIDYHDGSIKTMVGNIDPSNPRYGQFDVASQGYRQPGSSFKPFIYATAFAQGVSPGEPVLDTPLSIPLCCGLPAYSPRNYDLGYHGLVTYRYALQNSFNIPAVKLLMRTGIDPALETAQKMGITTYLGTPNYAMVLGTLSVHVLDQTAAFGTFANKGVRIPPHSVQEIADVNNGKIVYTYGNVKGEQVISPQVAYMITDVLSDNTSRVFEFGKCSALYLYTTSEQACNAGNTGTIIPAAAKTGTSTDFIDNWTVGYTSHYVVGVWAGNNDNSPMVNVTGVDGAGPIWHDTMLLLHKGLPIEGFTNPGGVIRKTMSYPGMTTTDLHLQ